MSFTGPPQWWKLHLRSLLTLKQALNSGENCFLNPFWHSDWHEQASQGLNSGKNLPAWASQNLDSDKNCFQDPSWYSNRRTRASLDLHSGKKCFQGPSWQLKKRVWALQDLHRGENCFTDFPSIYRGMHKHHGASTVVKSGLYIFPDTQNRSAQASHNLHSSKTTFKVLLGVCTFCPTKKSIF